jgi:low temperature requirement protein LtrA
MSIDSERGALFRAVVPNQHNRVTYAELFFDLVFVFAVTQVAQTLLTRFTALGAIQATLLFLAVWWVWVFTTWVTNWLNPELTPVRTLLFLLMFAGLVLSTSVPHAFDSRGLWFALAYASMQVGRTLFWLASTPKARVSTRWSAIRILIWLSTSAVFWILGGLAKGQVRLWLWGAAIAIEYVSPLVRFWIPRYGASAIEDWYVEGGHMAERCAGFVIIALGEAIVDNGATFAGLTWTPPIVGAFAAAFLASIAMWWIYFDTGARAGSELISKSTDPGRLARDAYTYLHMPIVAGIVLSAVADALVLKAPTGHADLKTALTAIGGPLLFLVGMILFKRNIRGWLQPSHGAGIVALAVLAIFARDLSALTLSALTTSIMVIVAAWESIWLRASVESAQVTAPSQRQRQR